MYIFFLVTYARYLGTYVVCHTLQSPPLPILSKKRSDEGQTPKHPANVSGRPFLSIIRIENQ